MRIKGSLKEFLSVELILLWMVRGVLSDFHFGSNSVHIVNFHNSLLASSHVLKLALVSISLPWTVSGNSITANTTKPKVKASKAGSGRPGRSTTPPAKRRKPKNYPQKQTSANNALLANIDFLTQLTNTKQEKAVEMDPLKCFPKALCGLSAESAAITRKRKNGLISDYIRLMKAVALNPSVMDKSLKKLQKLDDQKQNDEDRESTEEDQDDDDEEDEEEEDIGSRRPNFNKRTSHQGYGYDDTTSTKSSQSSNIQNEGPAKKRTKRKETIPKNSEEFTKQFLQEKAHVERLLDDGFFNEETESQNWWAYENEKEPELEDLVDWSADKLDSGEPYYTFGGKRKPSPPSPPEKPNMPPEPQAPGIPFVPQPLVPPPRPQPPPAPVVRVPENNYDSTGAASVIGNFFRNLFGFGSSSSSSGAFKGDQFFQGFQRSLPDGTPTVVTVDKTKEILTTAIEIGETLRTPNQCNSLFNGCKYQYIELLHVIEEIRESLEKRSGKDESFYTANDDENYSEDNADDTHSSYGYKSSLSEISQAETYSPDYNAAASAVTGKNKRKKKKKPSFRGETLSSMSRETSIEIGSDEPTLYGSGQHNFDFNEHDNLHHSPHHHRHQNRPPHYNHHPSYQFEDMYDRQPKTIWGTILSWFGFR